MVVSPGRIAVAALPALLATGPAMAQVGFVNLSLEELGNVVITSTAKREQRLADAPASVFVITADDIRRSGATRLPEALRLAPNLQVARITGNEYAINARGFGGQQANKLLVLIDGRSVYTPLFGGVFWDVQDLPMENIERIEVVSGPGSTLWGVNAVNGVVNVITRSAAQTPGTLVSAGTGNRERLATLGHALALPGGGGLRVHLKHTEQRRTETAAGTPIDDAGHMTHAGFRADWGGNGDRVTLLGNAYRGRHGQPLPGTIAVTGSQFKLGAISLSGANLLARWERPLNEGTLSVQAYFDRTVRQVPPTFDETLQIADLEVQYTRRPLPEHQLALGASYRRSQDRISNNTPDFGFLPAHVNQAWASLFAQDEITLAPGLQLTLGARVERNDYTGAEFLPNLRLAWKPSPRHLWWGSLARTVRAPSRLDRDTYVPVQPPFRLAGGPDLQAETANVAELGYRGQPLDTLTLSATAFRAEYDRLRTQNLAASRTYAFFGNGMRGKLDGIETWASLQATTALRLHAGFTRLWPRLQLHPGVIDTAFTVDTTEGNMPRRQLQLRAALNLPRDAELDLLLRHVSRLTIPDRPVFGDVPAYTAVDLRLGARVGAGTELTLTAQNLFDRGHGEFSKVATRSEFGRGVFIHARSRF